MNYTYLHYQIGLNHLCGVGPKTAKRLIEELGSAKRIYTDSYANLAKSTGLSISLLRNMRRSEALCQSEKDIAFIQKNNLRVLFYLDEDYPERLRHCDDGPINLFLLGNSTLNAGHFVAIVGTRNSTLYGHRFCERLIKSFQGQNITVVSGLANGIDSWAHQYCVKYEVPTIAVLAHGLDRIYPSNNKDLAKSILANGALITEFNQDTKPDRENFPKRNRIVAGMCDAVIVVESKEKGGSLITSGLANDYNRDVFALPGDIDRETSAGCNMIIANDQAHLLTSPESFLEQMGWKYKAPEHRQRKLYPNLSNIQQGILDLITTTGELHLDNIALKMKRSISCINVELLQLEIEGAVIPCPGNRYKIP